MRKHKGAALARKFCGVVTDFSHLAERGEVSVCVDEERRRKVALMCEEGQAALPPSAASQLHGKLQFTLSWAFGRVGRAALQPISRRAQSKRRFHSEVTPAIRRALSFLKDVVEQLPPRVISLDVAARSPVLIWSDAMWEAEAMEPAGGGFVIVIPEEGERRRRVLYALEQTGEAVLRQFVPDRKQYIGQLELLYAVAPYYSAPRELAGRQVIHFIDNTGACAALVKGYARAIDSGLIVNAFHAWNAGLRAEVFFEYVRSKANIADLPSRGALEELLELLCEMGVSDAEEIPCKLPSLEAWGEPAAEWLRRARAQRGGRGTKTRGGKKQRLSHDARV